MCRNFCTSKYSNDLYGLQEPPPIPWQAEHVGFGSHDAGQVNEQELLPLPPPLDAGFPSMAGTSA
jgi:hypothetical protein